MRLAAVLLLLVLPSGAGAQPLFVGHGEDGTGAVLPARVVVSAVPELVRLAVQEAVYDGTADKAAGLHARWVAMVQAAEREPLPGGSFTSIALASLQYASEVAHAAATIAPDISALARGRASCAFWFDNATAAQVVDWAREVRPAVARLHGTALLLESLGARAPPHVDPTPLREASALLRQELEPRAERCLPAADLLGLSLVPLEVWPGGQATAIVSATRNGSAALTSPFGDVTLQIKDAVLHPFEVPPTTPLGSYAFTARMDALEASAVLDVRKAPSRLLLDAPLSLLTGQQANFTVRVASPLAERLGAGPLRMSGTTSGEAHLVAGVGRFSFVAPGEPGVLRLRFDYPGSEVVEPSNLSLTLQVRAPAPPAATSLPAQGGGPRGPLLPAWAWVAVAGVAVALVGAAALHGRGRSPSVTPTQRAAPLAPLALVRGTLLETFIGIVRALRARGLAAPSDTPREIGARGGPELEALVPPFEAARYGSAAPEVQPSLLDRALSRARAWLGVDA